MRRAAGLLLAVAVAGIAAGCTANRPWRTQRWPAPACSGTTDARGTTSPSHWNHDEPDVTYKMFVIEFDDQGDLFDPRQVDDCVREIRSAKELGRPVFGLLFIHGWHHNASPKDRNLLDFEGEVRALAIRQSAVAEKPVVVGVYLAWRGESFKVPWLNGLTFWSRRSAAKRVGGLKASEVIYRVAAVVKLKPDVTDYDDRSHFIAIGHSFGGRILETAILQSFMSALYAPNPAGNGVPFRPLFDLAVLVNEASEALPSKQMIEALRTNDVRDGGPIIVSVTSVGDNATKNWFPAGQWFVNVTKKLRKSNPEECGASIRSQRRLVKRTAGHLHELYSHDVVPGALSNAVVHFGVHDGKRGTRPYSVVRRFVDGKPSWNDTPFWILRVPKDVLHDHNDIFENEGFRNLLVELYAKATVFDGKRELKFTPAQRKL